MRTWVKQLRVFAGAIEWTLCPRWPVAYRWVKKRKSWQDAWDTCRTHLWMMSLLDALGVTDAGDPPSAKAKEFERLYKDAWVGDRSALIRKFWPKAPRLPKIK